MDLRTDAVKRTVYTEDHEAFRAPRADLARAGVSPRLEEFIEAKAFPRDIWISAGRKGFLGLEIPEEYGGAGADDFRFNAVLSEEMPRCRRRCRRVWGSTPTSARRTSSVPRTDEQKERWLPRIRLAASWSPRSP